MDVLKGEHCSVDICRQLDFLPFTCEHCGKVFCVDHSSQDAHSCPAPRPSQKNTIPDCPICGQAIALSAGESPDTKVSLHIESGCKLHILAESKAKPACSYHRCKSVRAPIQCKSCLQMYCAEHRFESDHKCSGAPKSSSALSEFGSSLSESGTALLSSLGFYRPTVPKPALPRGAPLGSKPATSSSSSAASSSSTSAMSTAPARKKKSKRAMKKEAAEVYKSKLRIQAAAKGRESIEIEDRFYLEISFDKGRLKSKKVLVMFFNKKQTIGRILDEICDERKIRNQNHLPTAEKLLLDCVRTGGVLPMDVPLHLLEPQLMSGDRVYLRYESSPSIGVAA